MSRNNTIKAVENLLNAFIIDRYKKSCRKYQRRYKPLFIQEYSKKDILEMLINDKIKDLNISRKKAIIILKGELKEANKNEKNLMFIISNHNLLKEIDNIKF